MWEVISYRGTLHRMSSIIVTWCRAMCVRIITTWNCRHHLLRKQRQNKHKYIYIYICGNAFVVFRLVSQAPPFKLRKCVLMHCNHKLRMLINGYFIQQSTCTRAPYTCADSHQVGLHAAIGSWSHARKRGHIVLGEVFWVCGIGTWATRETRLSRQISRTAIDTCGHFE